MRLTIDTNLGLTILGMSHTEFRVSYTYDKNRKMFCVRFVSFQILFITFRKMNSNIKNYEMHLEMKNDGHFLQINLFNIFNELKSKKQQFNK